VGHAFDERGLAIQAGSRVVFGGAMMAERAAKPRPLMAMSGIGLAAALALWAWWLPADDEAVEVGSAKAGAKAGAQSTGLPASLVRPMPSTPAVSIPPPVPMSVLPFATMGVAVPIAVSAFPDELYQAPQSWVERAYPKLIFYKKHDRGGHFAAWEQPQALVEDLRVGFRSLRQ